MAEIAAASVILAVDDADVLLILASRYALWSPRRWPA